jgi:hypothetical protein
MDITPDYKSAIEARWAKTKRKPKASARRHNVSDQRPGDRGATKNKSSGIAGFAASDG